jgi:hypothetical protein
MNIVGLYVDAKLVHFCSWLGAIAFFLVPLVTGYIKIIGYMINKGK